jgi:hypothetical protein
MKKMSMNTTTRPELENAMKSYTLALFLGVDLSRAVTGLPSRADLARDMARRYHLDESLTLAEVAQRVSQAGKSPQAFQQGIVTFVKEHGINTIITTAYDNLLEVAFQQAGFGLNRVVRGSDASFIKPDRPTLIKLYGDAQQPEALVVTDRDHSQLLRDRDKEDVIDAARHAFKRNTILFYGYNLSDPDFKFHEQHPYVLQVGDQEYRVDYLPAESNTGMFGGNSNWRGPVWMPVNVMIIRALQNFYLYYGDNFKIECPTGSGHMMNLFEVSKEIANRLIRTFTRDISTLPAVAGQAGRRPVYGGTEKFQSDPHWRDYILFYEYFHGDNGAGLGASHQTGWTGDVAKIIQLYGLLDAQRFLEVGKTAGFVRGTSKETQT